MQRTASTKRRPSRGTTQADTRPVLAPNEVARRLEEALEAHRRGKLAAAEAAYADVLAHDPRNVDALNLRGAALCDLGRTDAAVASISEAVTLAPEHADAHLNLAEVFERAGRTLEAVDACRAALLLLPDAAEILARMAWLQARLGHAKLATSYSRVALALHPQSVEALNAQAYGLWRQGQIGAAERTFRVALAISPSNHQTLLHLAGLLCENDGVEEASALYARARDQRPHDAAVHAGLARLAEVRGRPEEAAELYRDANELSGGVIETRFNFARCLRDGGRIDEAKNAFGAILIDDPDHAPTLYALSRMKSLSDGRVREQQLLRIFQNTKRLEHHRIQAAFAHGELLDRAQDYDGAFARFGVANRLYAEVRRKVGESFDRAELKTNVDVTEARLAREFAQSTSTWGAASEAPVFVVGMPRSGTTLVEQVCASHSEVHGAGELNLIQSTARRIALHNEGRDAVADWDAVHAHENAQRVLAELEHLGDGARRVIDKTPLNVMRLGLIGALLPNARVVWCRRDVRDVVVSNHLLYFGQGNVYSTSLADCAYFARQVDRLASVWRQHSRLRILEVNYEALVENTESESRRIIEFLGLDWEPRCLEFFKDRRHVMTPSTWQVRQPIYGSSVGRWRRYERHLAPLMEALAEPS